MLFFFFGLYPNSLITGETPKDNPSPGAETGKNYSPYSSHKRTRLTALKYIPIHVCMYAIA